MTEFYEADPEVSKYRHVWIYSGENQIFKSTENFWF